MIDPILLFFVFPLVTIIFALALERIFNNPFLVSAIIFGIFLILAFTAFSESFIIAAIAYGILAFLTALIYSVIRNILERLENNNNNGNNNNNDDENDFPNTNACRTCCCQRQYLRCLRGR